MSLSLYYLAITSVFLCPVEKQEPKNTPGSDSLPADTNAIKTLTVKQVTELAKSKGILGLDGIKTLPIEVATELAKSKGTLVLDGIKTLPVEVATELAKSKGTDLVPPNWTVG